jgi:transposase-like protein
MYLYRAVDSVSNTLDFLLNETRSTRVAKRFFRKMLGNSVT